MRWISIPPVAIGAHPYRRSNSAGYGVAAHQPGMRGIAFTRFTIRCRMSVVVVEFYKVVRLNLVRGSGGAMMCPSSCLNLDSDARGVVLWVLGRIVAVVWVSGAAMSVLFASRA